MSENRPPFENDIDDTSPVDSGRTRMTPPVTPPPGAGHVRPTDRPPQRPTQSRPPTIPPNRRQRSQGKARNRRNSGLYLPLWSLGLMLIGVLVAAFVIVFIILELGGNITANSTPIVRIITAVPSHTPQFQESVLASPTLPPQAEQIIQVPEATIALDGPTLQPVDISPTPERIDVGKEIVVVDVGETLLNVRDNPGTIGTTVVFRANEGERYMVREGPRSADGFTWWRIESITDPTRTGWAAERYLSVNQQ